MTRGPGRGDRGDAGSKLERYGIPSALAAIWPRCWPPRLIRLESNHCSARRGLAKPMKPLHNAVASYLGVDLDPTIIAITCPYCKNILFPRWTLSERRGAACAITKTAPPCRMNLRQGIHELRQCSRSGLRWKMFPRRGVATGGGPRRRMMLSPAPLQSTFLRVLVHHLWRVVATPSSICAPVM